MVFDQLLARNGLSDFGNQDRKAGSDGGSRPGEQKKRPGPDQNPLAKAEGTGKQDTGYPTQRTLVEKGKKHTGGGKNRHSFMQIMTQVVKKRYLVELAVFQDQG